MLWNLWKHYTHHKSIGDLSSDHAEGDDIQRRVVLIDVRLALLEYDERRDHHERERDDRRQDTRALGGGGDVPGVLGGRLLLYERWTWFDAFD